MGTRGNLAKECPLSFRDFLKREKFLKGKWFPKVLLKNLTNEGGGGMKKIAMVIVLVIASTTVSAFACPLPVDVKIQKVASNSKLTPANAVMSARLRSQLRTAFSCRGERKPTREIGRDVINVELVEIIHQRYSTRVNVATDRGFFSERAVNYGLTPRERLEMALKQIAESISETVCK